MPDRTVAPAIHSIQQVSIPEANMFTLDNGLLLFYINAGQQPVIRLEIVFMAGKWFESRPGLSYFTGKMLTEGTDKYSAREIADLFDALGAFVEIAPGFDRITLTVHLLSKHLPDLLPTIKEIISVPAFKQSELENVKKRKKQQLLVDLKKNNFVAAQNFTNRIFGKHHPYGRTLTIEGIEEINIHQVQNYFDGYLKGNYQIIVSGMVDDREIQQINKHLGQEPANTQNTIEVASGTYQPSDYTETKDDSLQSSIRMGMAFIDRHHEDYLDMVVVNEILGGYFGSRLMRNIREEKGYTYGIRSVISSLKHASLWAVSTDVKKEYCQQTIEEIHKEISVLQREPISDNELETVKNYMLGTFISAIDTPFALADKFKTIHYSELDYDYFQRYFQSIQQISSNRIIELSQQYFDKEKITTVTVG